MLDRQSQSPKRIFFTQPEIRLEERNKACKKAQKNTLEDKIKHERSRSVLPLL